MPLKATSDVTFTILYDNNADDKRLATAWGFSCLIEGLDKTLLFDTGGGELLLSNMQVLDIDPKVVDIVVLSHTHRDHVGGLAGFLDGQAAVTVYVPDSFPHSIKRTVIEAGARLVEVDASVELCCGARSGVVRDAGISEQALFVETGRGQVVVTGCAHPGIVDIVREAKDLTGEEIHLVMGGFHLGSTSETRIAEIVNEMQALGVERVAPCHCSGERSRTLFADAYGEHFVPAGVGSVMVIKAPAD